MAKRATPQAKKAPLRSVPKTPPEPAPKAKSEGSNAADLEAFHYHLGCITRAEAAVAAVRKTLKSERRRASDAGIHLGDLDFTMKMREEEPETVQATIRRIAQYTNWMGLSPGVQADLFVAADEKADLIKVAEQEGYVEGLEAAEGMSPTGERYDVTTETGQARLKGWNRGQAIVLERWVSKQKPADPPATDPAQADIDEATGSQVDTEQVPEGATVQ